MKLKNLAGLAIMSLTINSSFMTSKNEAIQANSPLLVTALNNDIPTSIVAGVRG